MQKDIFYFKENDDKNLPKECFNAFYRQGGLEDAICAILERKGISFNYVSVAFPDLDSFDEEDHFDGVRFNPAAYSSEDIYSTISDIECLDVMLEAIEIYLSIRPNRKDYIDKVLSENLRKWPLSENIQNNMKSNSLS